MFKSSGKLTIWFKKTLKVLGYSLLGILLLVTILILLIRTPVVQKKIIDYVTSYVSKKTGTVCTVDKIFITFKGDIYLENLYLEDEFRDTLLLSGKLETGVKFYPLIFKNDIQISRINWEGLRANINRDSSSGRLNYEFLIDAFSSGQGEINEPTASEEKISFPSLQSGKIELTDFRIIYSDDYDQTYIYGSWNKLVIHPQKLNLNQMQLMLKNVELTDANISMIQKGKNETIQTVDDNSEITLSVSARRTDIYNSTIVYQDEVQGIDFTGNIGRFQLDRPDISLENKRIKLKTLDLADSKLSLLMQHDNEMIQSIESAINDPELTEQITFPDWNIDIKELKVANNSLLFHKGNSEYRKGQFNSDNIGLYDLHIQMEDIVLKNNSVQLLMKSLNFSEKSGLNLKKFTFYLTADERALQVSKLHLETSFSMIQANAGLTYKDLNELVYEPENSYINLNILSSKMSIQDALFFQPDLKKDTILDRFIPYPLELQSNIHGQVNDITIEQLNATLLRQTHLKVKGNIKGLPNMDSIYFDMPVVQVKSTEKDIQLIVQPDSGQYLPAKIDLRSSISGTLSSIDANALLTIPDGKIKTILSYKDVAGRTELKGQIHVNDTYPGRIIDQEELGLMDFEIEFSSSGNDLNNLQLQLTGHINQLEWKDKNLQQTDFGVNLNHGNFLWNLNMQEPFAQVDAVITGRLDSLLNQFEFDIDAAHLDLYDLGFYDSELYFQTKISGSYKSLENGLIASLKVSMLDLVHQSKLFSLMEVRADLTTTETSTDLMFASEFAQLTASGNTSLDGLVVKLEKHFKQYYEDTISIDTISEPVLARGRLTITDHPIIREVLVPDLDSFETAGMDFSFDESNKRLNAEWYWNYLSYDGILIKGLNLNARSDPGEVSWNVKYDYLSMSPILMYETSLSGKLHDQILDLVIQTKDSVSNTLLYIETESVFRGDTIHSSIKPDQLIINKDNWSVPAENVITYTGDNLKLKDLRLTLKDQELHLYTDENKTIDHLNIHFDNFKLKTLTGLLHPDAPPADGILSGDIQLESILNTPVFLADMQIDSLVVLGENLGQLMMIAEHSITDSYNVSILLHEGPAHISFTGYYEIMEDQPLISLDAYLYSLELPILQPYLEEGFQDMQGILRGRIRVEGKIKEPEYEGVLDFDNASLKVVALNETFRLSREIVKINNEGIFFEDFKVTDSQGQTGRLNGYVSLDNLQDPGLFLDVEAANLRVLNSGSQDNELFYGTLLVDASFNVRGKVSEPVVNAKMRVNRGSAMTFIVPESEIAMIEKEGVVLFVNMTDPEQLEQEEVLTRSTLTGVDLNALLEIDSNTVFTVIVDERSGDQLNVRGKADLNLSIQPNGIMYLAGSYEVSGGSYELSMYDLVKRRFEFVRGSRITWSGDPAYATLDLAALYRVRTSPMDLMADQIIGLDPSQSIRYRQELPFQVYLYIKGELLRPDISFRLDMPENDRGAFGGNVYARINQLNQDESELNKQVFALMVLNRFLPQDMTGGPGTTASTMARSSVSQVLSNQLNQLSGRYIRGVELDFDLDSYTDFQSGAAQDRTQLNLRARKALMDDRLVISVGSSLDLEGEYRRQQQNPADIIGDISIEYLITQDGKYRLRGFRRNEFEGLVEGQIIVTGMSFIYNREFNSLRELLQKPLKEIPEVKYADPEIKSEGGEENE